MSLHYRVDTEFSLNYGKPSLINISLNSTTSGVTLWALHEENSNTFLKPYRIFQTLKEAQHYINYLLGVYKHCHIPHPVLDSGQKELF